MMGRLKNNKVNEFRTKILVLMFVLFVLLWGYWGTLTAVPILLMIIFMISVQFTTFLGSSWLPTPKAAIKLAAKEMKAAKARKIYDLGSGDGRVVIALARETGAEVVGIELDPLKWLVSTANIRIRGIKNAKILRKSFYNSDIGDADAVFVRG